MSTLTSPTATITVPTAGGTASGAVTVYATTGEGATVSTVVDAL